MKQVGDNVYSLGASSHNFYFLVDVDEVTIIDAGCSKEWSQVANGLNSLGLTLESVAGVIATHAHADHFGLAKKAQDHGLDVSVHRDEKTRALGTYEGRFAVDASELPKFNWHALKTFAPMLRAGVNTLDHVDRVGTFDDGDRLDLPGHPVAAHTPGHTEGHTMFHCPDLGLLFTGDGIITTDLLGPDTGPQMIENRFNLDTAQALESLDRIVDLDANLLLPGHGDPWVGSPSDAVSLVRS
jgi:glyoxylase-like metal-dependent hydrolase (beta-lactamase superfamily II)